MKLPLIENGAVLFEASIGELDTKKAVPVFKHINTGFIGLSAYICPVCDDTHLQITINGGGGDDGLAIVASLPPGFVDQIAGVIMNPKT